MGAGRRDGALFLLVIAAVLAGYYALRPEPGEPATRDRVMVPADANPSSGGGGIAVSPDGTRIVYPLGGTESGLYLWDRTTGRGLVLANTAGAGPPAFAPDGGTILFVSPSSGRVTSVRTDGASDGASGPPARPAPARLSADAAWLYYTDIDGGIGRAPAAGGASEQVTVAGRGEEHRVGDLSEDQRTLLVEVRREGDISRLVWQSIVDGTSVDLGPGSSPRFGGGGTILFVDDEDASLRIARIGDEAVPRIRESEGVLERIASHDVPYALTTDGQIIALRASGAQQVTPVWVGSDGARTPVQAGWAFRGHRTYSSIALSADESRVAWSMPSPEGTWDLYVADMDDPGGTVRRLTAEGGFNYRPHFVGADELVFVSDRAGQADAWRLGIVDGVTLRVLDAEGPIRNATYTPDGRWLVYREGEAPVADLFARPVDGGAGIPVADAEEGERAPRVSPDGRWVAYAARMADGWEIMVTPAPPTVGPGLPVSVFGGEEPVWSRDGTSLFYRSPDQRMMRVTVPGDAEAEWGLAEPLFDTSGLLGSDGRAQYEVAADGRFLMLRDDGPVEVEIVRIQNALPSIR